jgi:hypothetical protein
MGDGMGDVYRPLVSALCAFSTRAMPS